MLNIILKLGDGEVAAPWGAPTGDGHHAVLPEGPVTATSCCGHTTIIQKTIFNPDQSNEQLEACGCSPLWHARFVITDILLSL